MFFLKALFVACFLAVALSQSVPSQAQVAAEALKAHNQFRAKHGVPALKLNSNLNAHAQDWANNLARTQKFEHRPNNKYGENLYAFTGSSKNPGKDATTSWYNEIKQYNYNKPGFSMATGHFTQVVWKNSKEIGVGIARGSNGWTYVVANYNPPGNYAGQFPQNVPRPRS